MGIDRFGQAAEASFGFAKPFHNRQDITQRTGQPIELPRHDARGKDDDADGWGFR